MKKYIEKQLDYSDKGDRNINSHKSDAQFDQLENNLLRISSNCNYLTNKCSITLPSLPKNKIEDFIEGLLPNTKLLIEPKIDGCAIALQYKNGNLEKAITRKGTDVTSKIIKIQNIPKQLAISCILQVRGELYAPNRTASFSKRISSEFLRAKKGIGKDISFCSFQILNSRLNQFESKKYLKKLGFSTPKDIYCNYTSQIKILKKQWIKGYLFTEYPANGIVVKINSRKLQLIREKSSNLVYPYWQMAITN